MTRLKFIVDCLLGSHPSSMKEVLSHGNLTVANSRSSIGSIQAVVLSMFIKYDAAKTFLMWLYLPDPPAFLRETLKSWEGLGTRLPSALIGKFFIVQILFCVNDYIEDKVTFTCTSLAKIYSTKYFKGSWNFSFNYHAPYAMHCFCWLSGLTRVAWAYNAAYDKRALIRINDQPPLL